MNPKILIVTVTADFPRFYEYYNSLDRLITPPGTERIPIHGSSPAKNRNLAIKAALKSDYTHLFFTDDDHIYPVDTIMKLLNRNVDIVSGLYTVKFAPFPLIAMKVGKDNPNLSQFIDMNQYGPDELIEVPRIPAGCLLVTTDCLREMQLNQTVKFENMWFTIGQYTPDEWCDDIWFCDVAYEAGFKCYIDTGVVIDHLTKCTLRPHWNGKEWEIKFAINEEYRIESLT